MAGGTRLASILLLSVFLFVRAQDDIYEPPTIVEPATARQEFHKGGEDVALQCRASGQPVPIYEWYRNGALVEDNGTISYNPPSGILTIRNLTTREEGFYYCRARNTFPNGLSAVVISPKVEVVVARIERGVRYDERTITATEGNYVFMTCWDTPLEYYGPITFKWLTGFGRLGRDDHTFIDSKGTLHFAYVMHTDGSKGRYSCNMHSLIQGLILVGRQTRLVVIPADSMSGVEPTLQFSTNMAGQAALTFERNTEGRLECFFSGYALKTQRRRVLEALPETGAVKGSERYAAEEQQMKSARLPHLADGDQEERYAAEEQQMNSPRLPHLAEGDQEKRYAAEEQQMNSPRLPHLAEGDQEERYAAEEQQMKSARLPYLAEGDQEERYAAEEQQMKSARLPHLAEGDQEERYAAEEQQMKSARLPHLAEGDQEERYAAEEQQMKSARLPHLAEGDQEERYAAEEQQMKSARLPHLAEGDQEERYAAEEQQMKSARLPHLAEGDQEERYAAEEQQMKSARLPHLAEGDQEESATDPDIEVPTIEWQDNAGNTIVSGTDRYTIESHGRVLKIASLEEADEQTYTCVGRNAMGTAEGRMTINVTASPVWVKPLQSTTVPRGQDAVFHCQARSAAGEVPPDPPRWFKNGQRLDVTYDSNKFEFSDKLRELRVKSAQDTDMGCFQCYVSNSEGEEMGNGCLTVFLPIRIAAKPPAEQTIEKGDIVNLTVVATADKLYPVAYKWHFNDITYEGVSAPPHVIYDVNTNLAYINTSDLTDQQMRDIRGVYRREVYREFETVLVDVDVKLKVQEGLPEIPVESADPHVVVIAVLGAVGGILILVIVLLVVLFKMKVYEECHTYLELLGDTDEDGYLRPLDYSPETTAVEEVNC